MKIINYMGLTEHPVFLRWHENRTGEFREVYHAHQGLELLYIHQGSGRAVIDQQIIELEANMLVFFKPFQLHHVQMFSSPEQPYVRSLFLFEPEALYGYFAPFPSLDRMLRNFLHDQHFVQVLKNIDPDEIMDLIRLNRQRLEQARPSERLEQEALFILSLFALLKKPWDQTAGTGHLHRPAPTLAEQIMQWIDAHYMEPFRLERLAAAVHFSPVHVSSLFRKQVGHSITEHLAARRIREACRLLKAGELSVREVGEAVGLSNTSYFCQLFRKNVGVSPYQYRKTFTESGRTRRSHV